MLAVNKPAGLLTQGVPAGIATLEAQVKAYLKTKYQKPGNVYLGIPHRLDRPVSGVVLFARNSKAARRLAEQFQTRQVQKRYWVIVEREPVAPSGTLTDWLVKLPDESRAVVVPLDTPGARECVLAYRTLERLPFGWLLEIELVTGRMHQIRVQLATRGWHVLGDRQYGASVGAASFGWDGAERIALHARSLQFLHPIRYDAVFVTAPVSAPWPVSVQFRAGDGAAVDSAYRRDNELTRGRRGS